MAVLADRVEEHTIHDNLVEHGGVRCAHRDGTSVAGAVWVLAVTAPPRSLVVYGAIQASQNEVIHVTEDGPSRLMECGSGSPLRGPRAEGVAREVVRSVT